MPPLVSSEQGNLQQPLTEYTDLMHADADAASQKGEPDANPVGLLETLKLSIFSRRMTLMIPIILYNGMR